MKNKLLSIILVFALMGCSTSDWMGDEENKVIITGERIAVLKTEKALTPDANLEHIAVVLPDERMNNFWRHSHSGVGGGVQHMHLKNGGLHEIQTETIGESAEDGYRLVSMPVVADGRVYVLDAEMVLSAYESTNIDRKLWEVALLSEHEGNLIGGGLVYDAGVLYATIGYDKIVAIAANNGAILWQRTVNGLVRSAPAVHNDMVLVVTLDNRTYALDRRDGAIIWTHAGIGEATGVFGSAAPVVSDKIAIIPHSSGEVYGLRAADGRELWVDSLVYLKNSAFTLADIDASPVLDGEVVYAASQSGILAANDVMSGARLWEVEIAVRGRPWLAGDYLYVVTDQADLVALSKKNGGVKWVTQLPRYEDEDDKEGEIAWTSPVLAGGKLWVVGSHGALQEFSPYDGRFVAEYEVDEEIYLPPTIAEGRMYLLTNDAELIVMQGK